MALQRNMRADFLIASTGSSLLRCSCTPLLHTLALLPIRRSCCVTGFQPVTNLNSRNSWVGPQKPPRWVQRKPAVARKHGLLTRLCVPHGIEVTVCHYPAGASKWNQIEHRMFNQISKNLAGEPLVSLDKMIIFLRTTRTEAGPRVRATLMKGHYPKAIKPTAAQMAALPLRPHGILPDWDYTISSSAKN